MTPKKIFKIFGYALDYGPVIITVILSTALSLKAIKKTVPIEELLQWILAVLSFIATTQLIDRFRIFRSIHDGIEKFNSQNREAGANAFFVYHLPEFQERLRQAKSISIAGGMLTRTSVNLWSIFHERLSHRGNTIRILVIDPHHECSTDMVAYRMQRHQDSNYIKTEIKHTLRNFSTLYDQKSRNNKAFQVRLMRIAPTYGIWIIDEGSDNAEIWVELYTFRGETEPAFRLLPHRDGDWFSFFERQFAEMWNASMAWEPEAIENTKSE